MYLFLFLCSSICLCLYVRLSVCLAVWLPVHLWSASSSLYLSICLSVCLPGCLPIYITNSNNIRGRNLLYKYITNISASFTNSKNKKHELQFNDQSSLDLCNKGEMFSFFLFNLMAIRVSCIKAWGKRRWQ